MAEGKKDTPIEGPPPVEEPKPEDAPEDPEAGRGFDYGGAPEESEEE